ncbi:MAG: FAD binding domain-containing protein [Candidatus Zophobacter franzmannii]|nr:FAD binding domain-containing protein [Candidatus Zophobacter franzmannii]
MKKIKVNKIRFWLNEKLIVTECLPSETALELVHRMGMQSVKEVCSEGDCGACTIAVGSLDESGFHYRSVTACIYPATKLHGTHVMTTEGLGTPDDMHIIQSTLYENHASQCGFCTPGIVMSVFALFVENLEPTLDEFKTALEGNLCRCTGYRHIVIAGEELIETMHEGIFSADVILPGYAGAIQEDLKNNKTVIEQVEREYYDHLPVDDYYKPTTLSDALDYLRSKPNIICGATDLFVEANIRREFKHRYLDISGIPEFNGIEQINSEIRLGATVTLDEAATNQMIIDNFPALCETVAIMSSQQIRNVATFAGNICNASPIADGTSALMGLNATVELMNSEGCTRIVKLKDFYLGYKKMEMREDELLSAIYLPIKEYGYSGFIKSSKRTNVDISSVNSCLSIDVKHDIIEEITISYGGVKECTALALETMEFLKGKRVTTELISEAMEIVSKEFTPISDVRGSDEYRSLLIKNHLKKHFLRMEGEEL